MRTLSAALQAEQQRDTHVPYMEVKASNKIAGVVRLDWQRLYTGTEDDFYHDVTIPGDGSLIRVRLTLLGDNKKLYWQRLNNPGALSDYSTWNYSGQYNCIAVAAASCGAEVSIVFINGSKEIQIIKSSDNGINWGSPQLIDYSPSASVFGLTAAYKTNGDIALFFIDQSTVYVKKYTGDSWQAKTAWDKGTGNLSGISAVYDSDWNLMITGQDTMGNYKVWSLVYGDGGDVPSGIWTALKGFAPAPSDSDFEYQGIFLDKADTHRVFFTEKYKGTESCNRPFWSYSIPDTGYQSNLWHEPVPFNLSSEYGLAIAHHGDYCWLSMPSGVWRALLTEQSLDLSTDIVALRQEAMPQQGTLMAGLRNDGGQYVSPGEGELVVLDTGCQLDFSPGYVTSQGNEKSPGLKYWLESYEHTRENGRSTCVIHAVDGWSFLKKWQARYQFRWNKDSDELSVKEIIEFILSRVGLKLEVKSQSSIITGYYPDFTVHPGDRGDSLIKKLLSFIPDLLLIEGEKAYLVNPVSTDSPVYSYGSFHPVTRSRYGKSAMPENHVSVEGYDPAQDIPVIVDSFDWESIALLYDNLERIYDTNITTVTEAGDRGESVLRKAQIAAFSGSIRVAVNCGQQVYDVVAVTDALVGLDAASRRVMGIALMYRPERGQYDQTLLLGAV